MVENGGDDYPREVLQRKYMELRFRGVLARGDELRRGWVGGGGEGEGCEGGG